MRITWGLVALAALVIAAPAGTRTADKPVPGGQYTYKKTLPKNPGWHSSTPPFNIVSAEVGKFGTKVRVGWTLETGSDCTGMAYGKKFTPPDGAIIEGIPVKPDGSFHGVVRASGRGVKYDLAEARGQFLGNGSWARISVRHHSYHFLSAKDWNRCGGKWLTFRAPLETG